MISLASHYRKMLVSTEGCPRNHTFVHKQSVHFNLCIHKTFNLADVLLYPHDKRKMFVITAEINVLLSVLLLEGLCFVEDPV